MSTDDDDLVRDALTRAPLADPGPCPDENALLAWASGHLVGAVAEAVESHLASCDACRGVLGDLRLALEDAAGADRSQGQGEKVSSMGGARGAGPVVPPAARGGRVLSGPGSRWAAIAAAVLLLAGAGVLVARREGQGGSSEGGLDAAVRLVARAAGDVYAAKGPIPAADLERGRPVDAPRGGLVVLRPRGVVFGGQPFVAWTAVPGVTSYLVTIRNAEGRVLWQADAGTRLAIPSDPASIGGAPGEGRVVEVIAEGALGRTIARSRFAFATEEERAALARARAAAATLPPGQRASALAHLAAQADWWEQALTVAEGAPQAHAIAAFVRKSLGLPLEGEVLHGER